MFNLSSHYDSMWDKALSTFESSQEEPDKFLNQAIDNRFGLMMVIKPGERVLQEIRPMLQQFQEVEPHQYFYPLTDIHFTVMSIISCRDGLRLNDLRIPEYDARITEAILNTRSFSINLKGITAFPGGVMIQGYPSDDSLYELREKIRYVFQKGIIFHTIDSRYKIETVHSTVIRFQRRLQYRDKFVHKLHEWRNHSFGTMEVNEAELNFSDWYQRSYQTTKLKTYSLLK